MPLLPFDLLARIVTAGIDVRAALGPLFAAQVRAFHALAVDDAGGWTGWPINQLTALLVEFKMNF